MLELLQFRHSPYNEKVRWALDIKHVPHVRRSLLPGPHLAVVKKLTGRTTTPVLLAEGQAIDGSARIIDWLEARYPDPPVLPAHATERAEALRIQSWFDDDLTPRMRRVEIRLVAVQTQDRSQPADHDHLERQTPARARRGGCRAPPAPHAGRP